MRVINVDLRAKRAGGRHRRQRPRKHSGPLWVSAIGTAVAAVLVTSVTAGLTGASRGQPDVVTAGSSGSVSDDGLERFLDPAHLSAVPVGPAEVAEPVQAVLSGSRVIDALGASGIPVVALRAYRKAASALTTDGGSCGLRWTLLAAIGRVESNHGRFGGAQLRQDGSGTKPIRGIPLDGRPHVALIRDTDGGALDGDTTYDRAVGPMQFIPSTWRSVGTDANGDGRRDPDNIYDAAQGGAVYLCIGNADLRDPSQAARAVRRYNNADEYVRVVLSLAEAYETGVEVVPSSPVPPPEDRSAPENSVPSAAPRPPTSSAPPKPPAPMETTPAPAPTDASSPAQSATPRPEESVAPEPAPSEDTATPEAMPAEDASLAEPTPPVEPPPVAAVGWAPAMREVVVSVLEETAASPGVTPGQSS